MVFMENRPRNVTVTCISFLYLPATRRERFNLLPGSQNQSLVVAVYRCLCLQVRVVLLDADRDGDPFLLQVLMLSFLSS